MSSRVLYVIFWVLVFNQHSTFLIEALPTWSSTAVQ